MRSNFWDFLSAVTIMATAGRAHAIPAFAVQTGQPCTSCHVGGLGPKLTLFGRQFKMGGFTARSSDAFNAPKPAMAIASFVQTKKNQAKAPASNFATNNNLVLDQASLYITTREYPL